MNKNEPELVENPYSFRHSSWVDCDVEYRRAESVFKQGSEAQLAKDKAYYETEIQRRVAEATRKINAEWNKQYDDPDLSEYLLNKYGIGE